MSVNKTSPTKFDLLSAVQKNDVSQVKRLLSAGIDVNSTYEANRTLLHKAASANEHFSHQETLKLLLKNGANVNAQDDLGETALHILVFKSHPKVVELLLKYNPLLDAEGSNGETPLFHAVKYGEFEIVWILVDRGANVNHRNIEESTLLHLACINYYQKIIKCLVHSGADLNARDSFGNVPLMYFLSAVKITRQGTAEEQETLRLLLEYSDITNPPYNNSLQGGFYIGPEFTQEAIMEQIAKLQMFNITVHSTFLNAVSQYKHKEYLKKCSKELDSAKSKKLRHSWVTFWNLLVDDAKKLKNYAGNLDLVRDFKKSDCLKKFPIYGATILKNMEKGIETRRLYDKSAAILSNCCPVYSPTHLIIRDILDCLNYKDYEKLVG